MPFDCSRCSTEVPPALYACPSCGERVTDFLRQYSQTPLDGKYHMLSLLGIGGMGEVYKAIHLHLEALRVIKLMRANLVAEQGVRERFLREARLATRIQHPNVAALFDFSSLPDGSWYMVWEFIDGVNLAQFVRERGRLTPGLAVRLAIQALQGLDAIHREGIIHRDISPENLMLTRLTDGTDRVKIIDLGVAKQTEDTGEQQTKTGVFVGKLKYASPEQLGILKAAEKIDGRSDIYSFGLVLYEMLTGVPPFQAETPHHYLVMHLSQPPMPISRANPAVQVPQQLEAVILKSLEKNRANRYQTAIEFAQALSAISLPVIDAETSVETLPPSSLMPTMVTPAPSVETPSVGFSQQTRSRPLGPAGSGTSPGARRPSDLDPALARRRELLEQIEQALTAGQLQQADVSLRTLRMHLGVRAESDTEFRRSKEALEKAAEETSRFYASEIQRAKDNGQPKEVARLLDEREQRLGRRLSNQAFRAEVDQWMRRRAELLERARSWINSESFASAREMFDELANHLGMGAAKDEEFRALEQSFHHAMRETNTRLLKSIAKSRDAGDTDGVGKLLSWRDSKFGARIEKPNEILEAEEWLRQRRRRAGVGVVQAETRSNAGRYVGLAIFALVAIGGVLAYVYRNAIFKVAPPEAAAAIQQLSKPKPKPMPPPPRPVTKPPLLDDAAREREGTTWTSPKDGQVYAWVPQTWFLMGCIPTDEACRADEKPAHTVGVEGFWIATNEVTVEAMRKYAEAKQIAIDAPEDGSKEAGPDVALIGTRRKKGTNWQAPFAADKPADETWPAVLVTWADAAGYCEWVGGRLPTEAEWEAVARERDQRTTFSWGEAASEQAVANLADRDAMNALAPRRRAGYFGSVSDGFATLAPAGSFAANRLGVHDLAGNSWEWIADWYVPDYYATSPEENVQGPENGEARVIRGGSFASTAEDARVSSRRFLGPDQRSVTVGFRCAMGE